MKKMLLLSAALMLLLPLAACSSGSEAEEIQGDEGVLPLPRVWAEMAMELPPISTMLIGTLRLEDTELAISSEKASELLPLWQAARTIFTSDTSASEEREAILEQIGEVMTAEQLAAIRAMELTTEDTRGMLRELLGDEFQAGSLQGAGDSERPQGGRGQGLGLPGIEPGEGFGGTGLGEAMDPEAKATAQAERDGSSGIRVNPMLFEILIDLLQERANEL